MRSPVQGCAVLLLFLLSLSAFGAEPAHDAALLARVVAAQHGHTTVQGELRWLTRRIDQADEPAREQRVRFFLAFPDRYAVVVTKPDDPELKQSFISDGTTRWEVTQFIEGEKPDVKSAPVGGDDEIERRLLACFRFDLAALQKDFTLSASATAEGGASIVLTPIAAKLAEQLVVLVLTFDAANRLTNIRSDDPQGNRLDFVVLKAAYDEKLDDALFHVGP